MGLLEDPDVVPAIIAAFISLLIAGVSGFYVLVQSNRKISALRDELLEKSRVERFLGSSGAYRDSHKSFKRQLMALNEKNEVLGGEASGTEMVQHVLNFFADAKQFYFDNNVIIRDKAIEDKLATVQNLIDKGNLNDPASSDRMKNIRIAFDTSLSVIEDLYQASLK